MLGRPLEELLGKTMDEIFPSELAKKMIADDMTILRECKQVEVEEEMNGRYYSTTKYPIIIDGKPMYLAGYTIDITSRKLAGDTINAALKEKEILLREVHHRVKNNLQVVSSLLNLQANKIVDPSIKEILEQSRNRIRSIALVHEKLYQTGNFAEINIKEYTRSLVSELFRVYLADPQKIHTRTEIEDVNIPLIFAIPYGLILNEIISNSLKYAFSKDWVSKLKPEIFIELKTLPNNYLQICIGDNGIGLPANYQLTDSLSLGLYLIRILSTEQLDGEIEIDNKKGTIFTITFNPYPV
jgi:two-component sensor histidine kinase